MASRITEYWDYAIRCAVGACNEECLFPFSVCGPHWCLVRTHDQLAMYRARAAFETGDMSFKAWVKANLWLARKAHMGELRSGEKS